MDLLVLLLDAEKLLFFESFERIKLLVKVSFQLKDTLFEQLDLGALSLIGKQLE